MNLVGVKKRMALIEAKLADSGAGKQYQIARGSGMAGLLAAIRQAKEARQGVPREPPMEDAQSPFHALKQAILAERAWREENAEKIYRDCAAIYDTDGEETCTAAPTTTPNMSASNE